MGKREQSAKAGKSNKKNRDPEKDDRCYICLDEDSDKDLIQPCQHCNTFVHITCIQEQLDRKNYKCGSCRKNFETKTKRKINHKKCMKGCGGVLLHIFLELMNWIGLTLFFFGATVADFDAIAIMGWFLLIPLQICTTVMYVGCWGWYWTEPCWKWYTVCRNDSSYNCFPMCSNHDRRDYDKTRSLKQKAVTLVAEILIVVFCHLVGHPLLIWAKDIDEWFTWRTSFTGLVLFYVVVASLAALYFGIYVPILYSIDRYSDQTVVLKHLDKKKRPVEV